MGQFKPMVKMMTTEPTVELKLKKGGFVNKKKSAKEEHGYKPMAHMSAGGDIAKLLSGIPMVGKPVAKSMAAAPKKPSVIERMTIMKGAAPMKGSMPKMKEGGESKAAHKAEMKEMGKIERELKSHEGKPASKAHKGLKSGGRAGAKMDAFETKTTIEGNEGPYKKTKMHGMKTGGVVKGQGGYKTGGVAEAQGGYKKGGQIKFGGTIEGNEGQYDRTKMHGMKTGGVAEAQGGYKKGGSSKKAFATGGKVDSGRPVAMPQGKYPAAKPAIQQNLSGVYKKGGKVK